jgi:hypothetical protein
VGGEVGSEAGADEERVLAGDGAIDDGKLAGEGYAGQNSRSVESCPAKIEARFDPAPSAD